MRSNRPSERIRRGRACDVTLSGSCDWLDEVVANIVARSVIVIGTVYAIAVTALGFRPRQPDDRGNRKLENRSKLGESVVEGHPWIGLRHERPDGSPVAVGLLTMPQDSSDDGVGAQAPALGVWVESHGPSFTRFSEIGGAGKVVCRMPRMRKATGIMPWGDTTRFPCAPAIAGRWLHRPEEFPRFRPCALCCRVDPQRGRRLSFLRRTHSRRLRPLGVALPSCCVGSRGFQ